MEQTEQPFECSCFLGEEQGLSSRIQRCAVNARRAGVPAETLVIALRNAWWARPKSPPWIPPHDNVLTNHIHTALEAYYGTP